MKSTEELIEAAKESYREFGSRDGKETILDEKAVMLAMSADNKAIYSVSNLIKGDEISIPEDESIFNERFVAYKPSRNQECYTIGFLASVKRGRDEIVVCLYQSVFMRGYRLVTSKGLPSDEIIYPDGEPAEDFQNAYSCAYSAFSVLRGKVIKVVDVVSHECWLPKRKYKPPYSNDDYEKNRRRICSFQYIDTASSDRQSLSNNCLCSHKNDIALTHYEFPDNERTIKSEAFLGCENLSEIEIPYGIKTIGVKAFYGCAALEQIDIPETVEQIGAGVFSGCSNLEAIHVSKRNSMFFDQDGILYQKALFRESETNSDEYTERRDRYLLKLVSYPIGKKNKILEVNTDESLCIGSYAFVGASLEEIQFNNQIIVSPHSFAFSDLWKIECPEGIILGGHFNDERMSGMYLRSRGAHFLDCCLLGHVILSDRNLHVPTYCFCNSGLESIELPQNIVLIGEHAFEGCKWLHSVEFACASLRRIGAYAFAGCKAIPEIALPNSLETIGDYAFSECSSLSNIALSPTLNLIGCNAFKDCRSLESIVIPASVMVVGDGAFEDCSSLKHIKICGTLSQITIEERAFEGVSPECIVEVPDGEEYNFSKEPSLSRLTIANLYSAKTEITIAEGETTIAEGDYLGSPLAKIDIPEGITTIGIKAFSLCRRATDIVFPRSLSTIETKAFADSGSITTIVSNMVSLQGVAADAFDGINCENCTVFVPIGCKTMYSRHPAFKGMNIVVDHDLG